MQQSALELKAYKKRLFEFVGLWTVNGFQLKVYTISLRVDADANTIDAEVMDAARDHIAKRTPEAESEGGHYGLGYVVLHQGEAGYWLLFDWWAHGDICCQLLSRAETDKPTRFDSVDRPLMCCVWEAIPIAFERDTWVDTMLCDTPDPEAYLTRTLENGLK